MKKYVAVAMAMFSVATTQAVLVVCDINAIALSLLVTGSAPPLLAARRRGVSNVVAEWRAVH